VSQAAPIIVVGAGIGGLTAALLLARAGWPVTLIERRTALDEEGAGLQLSPNVSRILIGMGLGETLDRRAGSPERIRIRRGADGGEIASVALGARALERYGAPYVVAHRADLAALLLDAVKAQTCIRLVLGGEAGAAREHGGRLAVTVGCEARDTIDGAAVIAASGLWSTFRFGRPFTPRFCGYAAWRALIPADAAPPFARADEVALWLAPNAHLVHYPIRRGEAVNIVAVLPEQRPSEGWSRPGDAQMIARAIGSWASPARDLIASASSWRCWSLFDRPPSPVWGTGRVTALGDAAHPMLPFLAQGAAMAIEDAAVLAAKLKPSMGDAPAVIEAALRGYEQARRARTARVQRQARGNAIFYHASRPLAFARDIALSTLSGERLLARYDWLYGWQAGA
jgi:salicylate hydroxylase